MVVNCWQTVANFVCVSGRLRTATCCLDCWWQHCLSDCLRVPPQTALSHTQTVLSVRQVRTTIAFCCRLVADSKRLLLLHAECWLLCLCHRSSTHYCVLSTPIWNFNILYLQFVTQHWVTTHIHTHTQHRATLPQTVSLSIPPGPCLVPVASGDWRVLLRRLASDAQSALSTHSAECWFFWTLLCQQPPCNNNVNCCTCSSEAGLLTAAKKCCTIRVTRRYFTVVLQLFGTVQVYSSLSRYYRTGSVLVVHNICDSVCVSAQCQHTSTAQCWFWQ